MDKILVGIDINSATSGQFGSLPGIDRHFGETIERHRNLHGNFNTFDDLWQVSGMNRSKFQILKRHFVLINDKPKKVKLDTFADYVCNGVAVPKSKRSSHDGPLEAKRSIGSGLTRQGTRYRMTEQTRLSRISPRTKSKINSRAMAKVSANDKVPFPPGELISTATPIETPANPHIGDAAGAGIEGMTPKTLYDTIERQSRFTKKNSAMPKPVFQSGYDTKQPHFVLQSSPSGNSLNFTCVINKQMLKNPAAMSFHFDQSHDQNKHGEGAADPTTPGGDTGAGLGDECMRQYPQPQGKNAEATPNNYFPQKPGAPRSSKKGESVSEISGATGSSPLSVENVLLYERHNTTSREDKHTLIDSWVTEVNVSRNLERIACGRERITPSGDIISTKNTFLPSPTPPGQTTSHRITLTKTKATSVCPPKSTRQTLALARKGASASRATRTVKAKVKTRGSSHDVEIKAKSSTTNAPEQKKFEYLRRRSVRSGEKIAEASQEASPRNSTLKHNDPKLRSSPHVVLERVNLPKKTPATASVSKTYGFPERPSYKTMSQKVSDKQCCLFQRKSDAGRTKSPSAKGIKTGPVAARRPVDLKKYRRVIEQKNVRPIHKFKYMDATSNKGKPSTSKQESKKNKEGASDEVAKQREMRREHFRTQYIKKVKQDPNQVCSIM